MYVLRDFCEKGDIKLIKNYISFFGPNILNQKDENGWTLLHHACFANQIDIVKLLISTKEFNGINKQNNEGRTPFHFVCHGNLDIFKLLIKNDRFDSLYIKNLDGRTPLHDACSSGHIEIVKLIIKISELSILNEISNSGYTPIHCACYGGHIVIVKELLKYKNIIVPDVIYNNHKINKLLEDYKNDKITMRTYLTLDKNLYIYYLVVFLSDNYFELKKFPNEKYFRFFNIAKQLPQDLQMVLIHRISGSSNNNITVKIFNQNLKSFLKKFRLY